jgi:hypothetical protein
MSKDDHIEAFTSLDDNDIMSSIKVWEKCDDFILSTLCRMLMYRNLYHVDITNDPPEADFIERLSARALDEYPIGKDELDYFVFTDSIRNSAYKPGSDSIRILMKDGSLQDIAIASDNNNVGALSTTVKKYIVGYTKNLI